MKSILLAALLFLLITPLVRADVIPFVRVQITYVDAPLTADGLIKTAPPDTLFTGDALADFKHALELKSIPYKITIGPVLEAQNGTSASLDKKHTAPESRPGEWDAGTLFGPQFSLYTNLIIGNSISAYISVSDRETVEPDGYWFKQPADVSALGLGDFKGHSGSTIYLEGSNKIGDVERFTFATATIVPRESGGPLPPWAVSPTVIPTPPADLEEPPAEPKYVPPSIPGYQQDGGVYVELTDIDVPGDLVNEVSDAMTDRTGQEARLIAIAHSADSERHPLALMPGVQCANVPRGGSKLLPLDGDKLSPFSTNTKTFVATTLTHWSSFAGKIRGIADYRIRQTVTMASRLAPDATAYMLINVDEHRLVQANDNLLPGVVNTDVWFHIAQRAHYDTTKLVSDTARSDGSHHLIYAVVTMTAPFGL